MDLVERIKLKCKENNTNIATLEKETGIGNGVIRRWNDRSPGGYQLLRIAERLNTSIEWLLTGKESGLTPEEEKIMAAYRAADPIVRKIWINQADSILQEQILYTSGNGSTGTDN